jgi:two-component system OmpR family sensor kinase
MPTYMGPDRRRDTSIRPSLDRPRLVAASVLVAVAILVAVGASLHGSRGGPEPRIAATAEVSAATLMVLLALAAGALYRLTHDCRAARVAVSLAPLGPLAVVGSRVESDGRLELARAVVALILVSGALFVPVTRVPVIDTRFRFLRLVVAAVTAGALTAGAAVVGEVSLRALSAVVTVVWIAGCAVSASGAARWRRHLDAWAAVFAAAVAAAMGVRTWWGVDGRFGQSLLLGVAASMGFWFVVVEFRRALYDQQRHALTAVIEATRARERAQAITASESERVHEIKGALAGIGAAAQSLARFADAMDPAQVALLTDGMDAEVRRLRELLERSRPGTPAASAVAETAGPLPSTAVDVPADVVAALVPVVRCWQAGETARLTFDAPETAATAVPGEVVANVVTELLSNAARHAPGAAVTVEVRPSDAGVCVRVVDDGPGFGDVDPALLFERGASSGGSTGLGLFLARTELAAHGATIGARPAPAGGAEFRIVLPAPPGRRRGLRLVPERAA